MDDSSGQDGRRTRDPDEVFCRNCGEPIHEEAEICPHCGVRNRDPPKSSLDSLLDDLTEGGNPFVAALASAVLPGLGQLYNRELKKGLIVFAASIVAAFSMLAFVGIVLYPAVWLYAIYDAYKVADRQSPGADTEAVAEADSTVNGRATTAADGLTDGDVIDGDGAAVDGDAGDEDAVDEDDVADEDDADDTGNGR